ncbi:hypothetical protein [Streptomyces sp. LN704]|uniref:hypothetical protein n=1 Tax=Streptomyces sp. LN704 TaxID=3112982 RepID=UPI0037197325
MRPARPRRPLRGCRAPGAQVEDGTVRKIDVYTKNPHEPAAFSARAEAGTR